MPDDFKVDMTRLKWIDPGFRPCVEDCPAREEKACKLGLLFWKRDGWACTYDYEGVKIREAVKEFMEGK
jgi:hypothetical protein